MTKQDLFKLLQAAEVKQLQEEFDHTYDLNNDEADLIAEDIKLVKEFENMDQLLNYLQEGMVDSEIIDYIFDVFPEK